MLVNLYTNLSEELFENDEKIYTELIQKIMASIEEHQRNGKIVPIERYIMFLERLFSKFDTKKDMDYYKTKELTNSNNKFKVVVTLLPYNMERNFEFNLREKLGYIKESIAYSFEIDSDKFDMFVDGKLVTNDKLDTFEYKDYYLQGHITLQKRDK